MMLCRQVIDKHIIKLLYWVLEKEKDMKELVISFCEDTSCTVELCGHCCLNHYIRVDRLHVTQFEEKLISISNEYTPQCTAHL